MIKRKEDVGFTMTAGGAKVLRLMSDGENYTVKGIGIAHVIREKGCGNDYHPHPDNGEFFYIIRGEGEYCDNGELVTVKAGDATIVMPGESHGIRNLKDEPLEYVAVMLEKI